MLSYNIWEHTSQHPQEERKKPLHLETAWAHFTDNTVWYTAMDWSYA